MLNSTIFHPEVVSLHVESCYATDIKDWSQYIDRKALKGHTIVDHLAHAPLVADHPRIMEFLDEHLCLIEAHLLWKLYFDSSYSSHGSSIGVLLVTPQGDYIPKSLKLQFRYTNNITEYEALVVGLKIAIE